MSGNSSTLDPDTQAAIDRLPANATEPGSPPRATEEPGGGKDKPSPAIPPAGPHADPSLVNPDSTPGTGALTPAGDHDDVDAASG